MSAPIALFVYNRPFHTAQTIAALKACHGFDPALLHVFSDGPKSIIDQPAVQQVRTLCNEQLPTANLIYAETNKGLAKSIISGTENLLARFGRLIVLEDDLLVAPDFLDYMNQSLDRYQDDCRVMQISGYLPALSPSFESAVFLHQTSSWSWATWSRAWRHFEAVPTALDKLNDAGFRRRFNRNGNYDYAKALHLQIAGKTDSWAIRWYWSVFKAGGLTLYPSRTIVANIGFDGSGTHSARGVAKPRAAIAAPPSLPGAIVFPESVCVDPLVESRVNRAYCEQFRNPLAMAKSLISKMFS